MPVPTTTPLGLRPYEAHGLEFRVCPSGEGLAKCPFCDSEHEDKFSANTITGLWQCFNCKKFGNALDFLRKLHALSWNGKDDYRELATSKRILKPESLHKWGLCKSIITGEWIVPGYNAGEDISQLYRYVFDPHKQRWSFWATPKLHSEEYEMAQGLFGAHLFDKNKLDVHLTEGLWDGIADWEIVGNKVNVISTPGCRIFYESWVVPYFKGRRVSILFDNDHPKTTDPNQVEIGPGIDGMRRVAGIFKGVLPSHKPELVRYLRWGSNDHGYDPELPTGHDIRDVVSKPAPRHKNALVPLGERETRLKDLLTKLEVPPESWPAVKLGSEELTCLPCTSWDELSDSWEKAMNMTPGLRKGLAVLMASALSTGLIGEQIWVRLLGPPSSGKTTLCEAMTVNKRYIKAVSTFTGFHSGYRSDKDGEEDHSLIPHIKGKTFIIKDGDTLLQAGNRELIMAEFRDIFDGVSRAHYRHGMNREYDDIRVSVVICGTTNLLSLDSSECGGRFIDCIVMDMKKVNLREEHKTIMDQIDRAWANGKHEVNGKIEKRGDSHKIKAMRLTGGYINYLRENAGRLAKAVKTPTQYKQCIYEYGMLVAYMRARPSEIQDEIAERELGIRLAIQYCRLAQCLAAATGKKSIDKQIVEMVREIALDTSRGKSIEVANFLYPHGETGASWQAIMNKFGGKEADVKNYMGFLRKVDVAESFELRTGVSEKPQVRWRLCQHVKELYTSIVIINDIPDVRHMVTN